MDVEWALAQLNSYFDLNERIPLPPAEAKPNRKTRRRGTVEERSNNDFVIKGIHEVIFGTSPRYVNDDLVRRLIWELTEGDQVRERLGMAGPAPSIQADELHPWVWEAARPHWTSGNHDAAVWAAGINVNSRLQTKVGRKDLGEAKLIAEAFSTADPQIGHPRLRLYEGENVDLFRDLHVGASNFGKGLYAAVRNVLNHADSSQHSIRESEALEALAAFSLLARWIERAEVRSKDD